MTCRVCILPPRPYTLACPLYPILPQTVCEVWAFMQLILSFVNQTMFLEIVEYSDEGDGD